MSQTFPSVTLILRADQPSIDQQIRDSVLTLGRNRWRAEVILVEPALSNGGASEFDLAERVCCRPIPKAFPTLGQAIQAAKHPLVAIVDPGFAIEKNDWQFVTHRAETFPVQTFFFKNKHTKPLKRLLIRVYSFLIRLIFGIRKHQFAQGLTLIQRELVKAELPGQVPIISESTSSTWELLSDFRLNKQPMSEVEVRPTSENQSFTPTRIRSKSIYATIGWSLHYWWNKIMFPRTQRELPTKKYKSREKIATSLFVLAIGCFIFLTTLNFPLFEPDEARNAQLALNVLESGEWLSLKLGDGNYWDKPPLQIWAIAASYSVFGPSQFATRLPIALASLLTIMVTLLLGKRLVGFRPAAIGTVLLMASCGFVICGRYVTMDATLTTMVTAMLLCGYIAIRDSFRKKFAIVAGLACGLGILVKGPVIGVLAVPPLIVAALLSRTRTHQKTKPTSQLLWFAIPAILVSAPWYIATAIIHPDFLSYFFWKHHVVRFSNAFNHREPFWYYFIGIFMLMFPASYLLPSVTNFMFSRKPENRLARTREHGFLLLSTVWIIGFFSISESKLPTYILPAFPLICLLMGVLVEQKILGRSTSAIENTQPKKTYLQRLQKRVPWELAFWALIICASLVVFFEFQMGMAVLTGLALAAAGILITLSLRNTDRPKLVWSSFGAVGLILVSVLAHQLIPSISATRSIHSAAKSIQSSDEFSGAPVVFFGRESFGAELNLAREKVVNFNANQTSAVVEYLVQNPNAILVSSKDPMETLRAELPWTIELKECEDARHLYLSRPNQAVIAREQASRLYR